jgi:hypothetical protein
MEYDYAGSSVQPSFWIMKMIDTHGHKPQIVTHIIPWKWKPLPPLPGQICSGPIVINIILVAFLLFRYDIGMLSSQSWYCQRRLNDKSNLINDFDQWFWSNSNAPKGNLAEMDVLSFLSPDNLDSKKPNWHININLIAIIKLPLAFFRSNRNTRQFMNTSISIQICSSFFNRWKRNSAN